MRDEWFGDNEYWFVVLAVGALLCFVGWGMDAWNDWKRRGKRGEEES